MLCIVEDLQRAPILVEDVDRIFERPKKEIEQLAKFAISCIVTRFYTSYAVGFIYEMEDLLIDEIKARNPSPIPIHPVATMVSAGKRVRGILIIMILAQNMSIMRRIWWHMSVLKSVKLWDSFRLNAIAAAPADVDSKWLLISPTITLFASSLLWFLLSYWFKRYERITKVSIIIVRLGWFDWFAMIHYVALMSLECLWNTQKLVPHR